jgi:hypothetical protein
VLREVEETQSEQPLPASKQEALAIVITKSQYVLQDLQGLVEKYESLGSQSKRAWDRLKWGSNDIAELRGRLVSTTVLLTAFFGVLISNLNLYYGVNPSVLAPLKLWLNESSTTGVSRDNQSSQSPLPSLQLLMTSKSGEPYEKSSKILEPQSQLSMQTKISS